MKVETRWVFAVFFAIAGCAAGTPEPRQSLNSPGGLLFNGYAKPDVNCFECHNGDATGTGRGPNLTEKVPKLSDDAILHAIDEGPGLMPSFKDKLTAAEKRDLVAWLRSRAGQK
jgi:mono/diheme cytochrome c family protein